jgi:Peptidase family M50
MHVREGTAHKYSNLPRSRPPARPPAPRASCDDRQTPSSAASSGRRGGLAASRSSIDGIWRWCHALGMRRGLMPLLPTLAYLAVFFGGQWLLGINAPHLTTSATVAYAAWLLAAFIVGMVVHELGHALAARLAGAEVLGITLGGKLASVTFHLGTVPVSVGLGLGGWINCRSHRLSAPRRAAIYAAGPAANVLVAPLCLLLPVPRWEAAFLALAVLASALQNLAPGHSTAGDTTDGYKLLRTRARLRADAEVRGLLSGPDWPDRPDAADILINGFRLDVPEAEDCLRELCKQPDALLRVYLKPWTLPGKPDADVAHIVRVLSWKLLASGDLPAATADLAAGRIEWVLDHLDKEHPDTRTPVHSVRRTLALVRLRQRRPQEVQRLCADALAADIDPDDRAKVLATVAMARHALLLSGRQQLDEALALDPDADLVSEAARFLNGGWETALAAYGKTIRTPDANRSLTGH